MSMTLYDLCGADQSKRFSPTCWRAKMALSHKGVAFSTVATPFTKIREIDGGNAKTVPYLVDGDARITDSFDIAVYLDEKYPDGPALFDGPGDIATAKFIRAWANTSLHPIIVGLVVKNIHDVLAEPDQKYFRETREKALNARLEDVQTGREEKLEAFTKALTPLRTMLAEQPFIGGNAPRFADYIVFGSLKWLMSLADFDVLKSDDAVLAWFNAIDATYTGGN